MSEAINRLCTYAEHQDENILLFQDMINEKQRFHQVTRSYAHIYSRIKEHQEMLRILEAPAYIDSELSTNIQCADWIAALIGRACDYQLIRGSSYKWVADTFYRDLHGHFTYESTLQFNLRSIDIFTISRFSIEPDHISTPSLACLPRIFSVFRRYTLARVPLLLVDRRN